ncbi:hypothetical protein VSR01_21645 [Actinacidiphila sp. DG2A-62]|uniref:hypothetical protein n=1 Tax=Actinacidiphila sp. DG2A-62 TaxID=3108821 RepID=UPI002DB64476|nr:hypothetical protein [Actinacidiphila sp. DG2A-62]MEC3995982.1 hypothetical protein [Actinacidiphila sp. DG2A-62]
MRRGRFGQLRQDRDLRPAGHLGGADDHRPAHPARRPKAPTFALPPDITTDFRGFTSSDPKQQAILTDARYAATAVLEFEAKIYTKETPNFKRFWTGEHGAEFADSIIAQGKDGSVITGSYPYYNPVVKPFSNGNVSVRYCEDQRKAYAKDSKTGTVTVTTPSLSDFRLWTLLMMKSPSGDWTVYHHSWVQGAKQCQVA